MRTTQDLNFKVTPDFHWRFKNAASQLGIPMTELLDDCFEAFLSQPCHLFLRNGLDNLARARKRSDVETAEP
ncbi:hypothetical protein ABIB66_000964 [Bradyrhizobium sp. F1.13.3]